MFQNHQQFQILNKTIMLMLVLFEFKFVDSQSINCSAVVYLLILFFNLYGCILLNNKNKNKFMNRPSSAPHRQSTGLTTFTSVVNSIIHIMMYSNTIFEQIYQEPETYRILINRQ